MGRLVHGAGTPQRWHRRRVAGAEPANLHRTLYIRKEYDYYMFYKTVSLNRKSYNIVDGV